MENSEHVLVYIIKFLSQIMKGIKYLFDTDGTDRNVFCCNISRKGFDFPEET